MQMFRSLIFSILAVGSIVLTHGQTDSSWKNCDRGRSRLARSILKEEFYPAVVRMNFTLPESCPFLQSNDMYLDNEMVLFLILFEVNES